MCGIAGFTHKNGCADPERIRKAINTLVHRGPDQIGVFRSPLVSLGAARLRIIDLHAGDQPLATADGNTTIVFNGEIYNYKQLRLELEQQGYHFRTNSDTEVVLYSFVEWNTDCFSRLRGMFALAAWTESTRTLVLARDRMGIKPLYIARRNGDLFFGSELKAILIHPEIERQLSLAGLDCYLSLNYVPSPFTLVEGIKKLPPGTWLKWRDGEETSDAYWEMPAVVSRDWTMDEAKEELDLLLKQSVREHLLSDVPIGVWLSGGIDSSTVLHYAATQSSAQVKTFSISFTGQGCDEGRYIRQVAERFGTDHSEFDLSPDTNFRDAIHEFAHYSDEPSADAGALPVWYLSKLSRTKTTVALSGEGADELFGGYLTYRANQISAYVRKFPQTAIRLALRFANAYPVSDDSIGFDYKVKRLAEGCLMPADRAHTFWNGTFSEAQKAAMVKVYLPGAFDQHLAQLEKMPVAKENALERFLRFDQRFYLPDDILVKTDRMSMAHSLEVRPPFLDHRIVQFAATLPMHLKIRGSRQKVLLKELMRDKLPLPVLQRKKMGFDIPAHEWLRGPLRAMLLDVVFEGARNHGDLFRPAVLQGYVTAHLNRRANLGYHLWGLLILFLWMKKWGIQSTAEPKIERAFPRTAATLS